MSNYPLSNVPCSVSVLDSDTCTVTFTIPVSAVVPLRCIIESLSDLFNHVNWKVKTDIKLSHVRNEISSAGDKHITEYANSVKSKYHECCLRGLSPSESLSQTAREVKIIYQNSSYDHVKNILTKSGALKKSGYYEKKS